MSPYKSMLLKEIPEVQEKILIQSGKVSEDEF